MTEARAPRLGRPSASPGDCPGSPGPEELASLARRITEAVGHLEVTIAGRDSPLPWSCSDIVAGQDRGQDPTAGWRDTVRASQSQLYRIDTPQRVAAAFVMQWYLGVVATPVAFAAVLSEYVLTAEPDALRFDLSDEEGYPVAVAVAAAPVVRLADATGRMALARRRYTEHAHRFVAGYRPPVKMSTLQRSGMVTDAWQMAMSATQASPAAGTNVLTGAGEAADEQAWRTSCCFVYALPGAQACARCPRQRPVGRSRPRVPPRAGI